jgi:hypothetical protein
MRKLNYINILALAIIFSLSSYGAQSLADERIYQMVGDITAIDLGYNTVVVEVPLAGKTFTVGGPLSSEAVLTRGGKSAALADFRVGDRITVKWEATGKGHVILLLKAK